MKQQVCDENCAWNPSRCACEYGEYTENAVYELILNDAAKKRINTSSYSKNLYCYLLKIFIFIIFIASSVRYNYCIYVNDSHS